MTETIKRKLSDSSAARWTAMLIVSFTMMCGYFITDVMSPLGDMLTRSVVDGGMGWTPTEYGWFSGAYSWLNIFLLMLLFGGIILDKMGVRFTALLSGGVMLLGAIIKWYAISDSFIGSGLETWFTNNLNHIPVFEQLNVSPFYGLQVRKSIFRCLTSTCRLPLWKKQ